jgi:hypothetical protein
MKKILIAMTVLVAFGLATVLDGVSGLGLGSNPAAPAVWKTQKRIDAGFSLLGKTADVSDYNGDDNRKFSYDDSGVEGLWVTYTDSIQDYWYTVGFNTGVGDVNGNPSITNKRYNNADKETLWWTGTETYSATGYALNLAVAKDLNLPAVGNFIGGVKVDINAPAETFVHTTKYTSDSYGGKRKEVEESSASIDPYLTFSFGAVKAIDAKQSVVLGQTLGTETRAVSGETVYKTDGKRTGKDKGGNGENRFIPAETALGYVYKVTDALEVAGTYVYNWGGLFDYQRFDTKGKDIGYAQATKLYSYYTMGLAADYIYSELQAQGYINWEKGRGVYNQDGNLLGNSAIEDDDKRLNGHDIATLGVNLLWTPSFANAGTIGVGIENSKDVYGDETTDSTTAALFYTYLF